MTTEQSDLLSRQGLRLTKAEFPSLCVLTELPLDRNKFQLMSDARLFSKKERRFLEQLRGLRRHHNIIDSHALPSLAGNR